MRRTHFYFRSIYISR